MLYATLTCVAHSGNEHSTILLILLPCFAGSLDLAPFDSKKDDSNSEHSELSDDRSTAQLAKEPAGNFSYGIHGLTKLTRCKLTLALLSMEMAHLGHHVEPMHLRHSMAQWFKDEVQVLSQLCCCYLDKERSPGSCDMVKLPADRGILHSLLGYTQLHSDIILNLECVRSELLLYFQEQHGSHGNAESPVWMSIYKTELMAKGVEYACHPWQLPLLSAALLPCMHPFSLARQLQSLTAELVDMLKGVSMPPLQVASGESVQAPTKEILLSHKLFATTNAVSNVLARCLTLSCAHLKLEVKPDSTQSQSSSTPSKESESPGMFRKSGKKVTFSFDVDVPVEPKPNSQPSKWPGVVNWPCLLPSEGGREPHSLCVLLVECIIPVFVALLAYSWIHRKPEWLCQLLQKKPSFDLWCNVCGGGFEAKSPHKEDSGGTMGKQSRLAGVFGGGKKNRVGKPGGQGIVTDRTSEGFFLAPKESLLAYFLPGVSSV